MSESAPTTRDPAAGAARNKRLPKGGGSNSGQNNRGNGFKRSQNQSGNRDSDSQASDVSTKRRSNSSRGRGGGNAGRRPSRPGSNAAPSPNIASSGPPLPTDGDSPALSNLQKVITDLKSIQPSGHSNQPAQAHPQQSQQLPAAAPAPTYAQTTQSNLTATAAPFQPSFVPGEVPPRHRKAQSMGPTPGGGAANAGYSMNQYAPYLDSMSEDAENQASEPLPPMAQFTNRQAMGSFSAPRFSSMSGAGGDQEYVGPSGRPQLAPSFSFGAKRRTNSISVGPAIGEEDVGFQFPQQNQQQSRYQQESDNQAANRRGGEMNEIMSQQIAIQSQIEALQQQQQHLLQQQLASNQVSI